ncbi:hypothetical protein EDB87DRAFT_1681207 [Lactarius vividus]|nr:hypothetical protein EDB87DRAFT_1681207 [Lactarius vividus]
MAMLHPATLPPPPEPYSYPAPVGLYLNWNPSLSPPPHLPIPILMPYSERVQSLLYVYPMTPLALQLPSAPPPLHGPLVIPPYSLSLKLEALRAYFRAISKSIL